MASEVRLPRLGQGMESATIVKWLKAEGERVERGEPLYEVDTDKATQEVEAEASGVLLRIAVAEGEVPVGETVGLIGEPGEAPEDAPAATGGDDGEPDPAPGDAPVAARSANGGTAPAAPAGPAEAPAPAPAAAAADPAGRVKASPLARRIARERGIDLGALRGTGPEGRIVAEDVEGAAAATPPAAAEPAAEEARPAPTPAPGEPERIPLTGVRRTIARRLTAAWDIPVFQLTVSAEMTRASALVERSRELDPEVRVTLTDLLAKVCARALMRHPELNAAYDEEGLVRFPSANVGIAVAAPQGLVVPVIASVERLSLAEVARARAALVERAREGRLALSDLEGGTFTISNLGMYGVEQFTAVLNPPQAAILAVGATVERPIARAGELAVAPMMTVTLTVDHRAVDGGPAAEFLRTVKSFLEDPALAL